MTRPAGPVDGREDGRIVDDPDAVVVNDRRRLDPETGAVRHPRAGAQAPAEGVDAEGGLVEGGPVEGGPVEGDVVEAEPSTGDLALELTADLQRVSAEYANYRRRVDRDRATVVDLATAGLLSGLLPVLDDVDRARDHGDLTGAFKGVADQLEALTAKLGLERFGAAGDPFDPAVHEALLQAEPDPSQSVATCAAVLQPGYRLSSSGGGGASGGSGAAGRILRPARVSVAEAG